MPVVIFPLVYLLVRRLSELVVQFATENPTWGY
jgi:hypothetical protein